MPVLALMSVRVWIELAIAALIAALCWWGYHTIYAHGANSVQAKWNIEKMQVAQQSLKIQTDNDLKTQKLAADFETQRSQTSEQIDTLNNHLSDALVKLRNRPDRPSQSNLSNIASTTKSPLGCTGSGLYKSDAEFLSRYANDTARLQLELKACYISYDAAREAVK